ncbi:MAG: hypothetical protein ABIP63_00810 [Thermoanaerobaculia bacterium]
MLIRGLTPQEIRVLQEFRRLSAETLPLSAITAIRHPAGGGEAPALDLVGKEFLTADAPRENFSLTSKARDFLAYDPKPEFEESVGPAVAEAAN